MHRKTINHRGQCRGRPPTRSPNKDGPRGPDFSFRMLHFAFLNEALGNQKSETRNVKPRDWITYTCSVSSIVKRNRDKDRWNERSDLLFFSGEGEVCPVGSENIFKRRLPPARRDDAERHYALKQLCEMELVDEAEGEPSAEPGFSDREENAALRLKSLRLARRRKTARLVLGLKTNNMIMK
jgi:hypothetical protein